MIIWALLVLLVGLGLGYVMGEVRVRRLARSAATDTLTGVYNRAWLEKTIGRLVAQAARSNQKLTLLMLDLNNFKKANDKFGHLFGDQVLQGVAGEMVKSVRNSDFIFRYGGDEFLIILPGTSSNGAQKVARKMKDKIDGLALTTPDGKTFEVGASMGLATFPEDGQSDHDLLQSADQAVYAAKEKPDHIEVKSELK